MTLPPIHPAVFSDNLMEPIAEMIGWHQLGAILDPCAGLGWKFVDIAKRCNLVPVGVDIEQHLYSVYSAPCVRDGDSTALPFGPQHFAAAVTSFVYPNGMADNFRAKDSSKRHTYVHRLRQHFGPAVELRPNNMAAMNPRRSPRALEKFMGVQQQIIHEVFRVLQPGAPFVVNTKDPPYNRTYTKHTHDQLHAAGFRIEEFREVRAAGMNHGANQDGKSECENLTLARRPA